MPPAVQVRPWQQFSGDPAIWTCAGVGAAAGVLLGPTWQGVLAGAIGATLFALARPIVLLTFIIATAGINFQPEFGDAAAISGTHNLDLNAVRLLGVLLATCILVARKAVERPSLREAVPFLAFPVFGAISLIWTSDRTEGVRFLAQIAYPIATLVLTTATIREGGRHGIWVALIVGSWASLLVNLSMFLAGASESDAQFFRYHGTLAPNPLGLFSAASVLTLYGASRWRSTMLTSITCLVMLLQLVATGSRTSLIALAGALMLLESLRGRWSRLGLLLLVVGIVWLATPAFIARPGLSLEPGSTIAAVAGEDNLSGRLFIWYDIWSALISGAEVVGRGIGSSTAYMAARYSTLRSTHSEFIRLLAETGFVGLALFVGALARVGWRLARVIRGGSDSDRDAGRLGLAALALLTVACLTENALGGYAYFVAPIFVVVAIGTASEQTEARRQSNDT